MRKRYLLTSAAVLLLITLPYLIAFVLPWPAKIFGGFLLNPQDGNTYLAKMQEGWSGSWVYTFPFSARAYAGAHLFLFYLFLGHLARWLGLSTLLVFHLSRVLCALLLMLALKRFFTVIFAEHPRVAFWAYFFSVTGTGLGWLVALFGGFTADFWVAEAYPFLSMYSNPHFPLGLAILLWFLARNEAPFRWQMLPILIIAGFVLGIALPFGVVVAVVVITATTALNIFTLRTFRWQNALPFLLVGGLTILYQYSQTRLDPFLAAWDSQNQTPSPPLWDFTVSFAPMLLLAIWGGVQAYRLRYRTVLYLAGWAVLGFLLIYLPFNLQRRFMLGYMIPLAGLAAFGLAELKLRRKRWFGVGLVSLALPTLLLIIAGGLLSVKNSEPLLVIDRSEMDAYSYLAQNGQAGDVVLASPESGLFLPGYSGLRVIYGHLFETIDAQAEKLAVEEFFSAPVTANTLQWARERGVRWVLWGPRENRLGNLPEELPAGLDLAFEKDGVQVFELQARP
ncbi:hypothetical protein FDZ74_06680 [bacterium]|nr:MAG: hypothetical protein FDZ74_06680 [bacterium]